MSGPEPSDRTAFRELTRLIVALGEELANYRRRALAAESRLRELREEMERVGGLRPGRVLELEQANADLTERLDAARARTEAMLARVRFLRQQHDEGGVP